MTLYVKVCRFPSTITLLIVTVYVVSAPGIYGRRRVRRGGIIEHEYDLIIRSAHAGCGCGGIDANRQRRSIPAHDVTVAEAKLAPG